MGSVESTPTTMDDNREITNGDAANEVTTAVGRRRRRTQTEQSSSADDPWWWEIENENLILDQVPNVMAATMPHHESESENRIRNENENESGLSEDFNSLLKIGEHVNENLDARNTTAAVSISKAGCDAGSETSNSHENENDNENSTSSSLSQAIDNSDSDKSSTTCEVATSSTANTSTGPPTTTSTTTTTIPIPLTSQPPATSSSMAVMVARDFTITTSQPREQTLEEFKEELRIKRLARQTAVQDLRDEIATLRKQLASEQALTQRLRHTGPITDDDGASECSSSLGGPDGAAGGVDTIDDVGLLLKPGVVDRTDLDDEDPMSRGRHANIELANAQLALQLANSENLSLRTEMGVVQKQVGTLKEVIACCKQMLTVKEEQCTQLKNKLQEIETSFNEREMKIMSANLRQEYERQLGNIRQLRQLYEERQRIAAAEQENLQRLISIKKDELSAEQEKSKNLEERNQTLMKEVENANNELATLREECNEHKFEKRALKEEMGAINTLFSQMVMGFNGKNNLDIDRLTMMLEENRTLLNDMATKEINCSDGATLPKLLFELVEQAMVKSKSSRSPTPIFTNSEEEGEEEEDENEKDDTKDCDAVAATNVATTISNDEQHQHLDGNEKHNLSTSELGATAICYQQTDKDNATATAQSGATATTVRTLRKHHRKNANNKMKLSLPPLTIATASTVAGATTLRLHEPEVIGKVASTQEIIGNLPKVWKVLMELLSHHKIEQVQFEENGSGEDCYKSVDTPNGVKAELSVSKTYIKLKDLILEKKSLVKETNRLKTLNSHLEYRLNEQEKRLSTVSLELTKTWHLVGKMQRQHRQLHTQEQILRYQLQQKRRLLSELKDELEYCRRKWAAARAKNDESQEQCNDLRREFAKRKLEDANNSAESGYSDSGPASDEEERSGGGAVAVAMAAASVMGGAVGGSSGSSGGVNSRRKHLKEMFEHTRKIKRMQSTSPGRAGMEAAEIVLRWNSAPPTCGWRGIDGNVDDDADEEEARLLVIETRSRGAIPKRSEAHSSRGRQREGAATGKSDEEEEQGGSLATDDDSNDVSDATEPRSERATRIQKLEEQCKSLIQQVLETSDNRERLEVQLCHFQNEIAPVQYAVPLEEFLNRKRLERMTRASSVPTSGTLTPREEEYTRKRSERLGRLEEESRQLMSRIKRTSDRGHYLRCSLDRIRRNPSSHEGSFESNTEDEPGKPVEEARASESGIEKKLEDIPASVNEHKKPMEAEEEEQKEEAGPSKSPLTADEEAYTARRAARLQRLEEESRQLLSKLSRNTERGNSLGNKLDTLHEQYAGPSSDDSKTGELTSIDQNSSPPTTIEQRIEDIEKISSNRNERLRILEEEGKQLLTRLSNTSERGSRMINRIAEREHNRQMRSNMTPSKEVKESKDEASEVDSAARAPEDTPEATVLMPTLKNVACSSIVSEELNEHVTVTTTPSQIAAQRGAIPKTKPTAQLNAAIRANASKRVANQKQRSLSSNSENEESLEEMVKRLRELPFPGGEAAKEVENEIREDREEEEKQVQEKQNVPKSSLEAEECKTLALKLEVEQKLDEENKKQGEEDSYEVEKPNLKTEQNAVDPALEQVEEKPKAEEEAEAEKQELEENLNEIEEPPSLEDDDEQHELEPVPEP